MRSRTAGVERLIYLDASQAMLDLAQVRAWVGGWWGHTPQHSSCPSDQAHPPPTGTPIPINRSHRSVRRSSRRATLASPGRPPPTCWRMRRACCHLNQAAWTVSERGAHQQPSCVAPLSQHAPQATQLPRVCCPAAAAVVISCLGLHWVNDVPVGVGGVLVSE